jgi:hypothetical protein
MITKYLIPIIAILSFAGGSFFGTKVLAPKPQKIVIPACPACNCPAAVSLQGFDVSKLNNKKGTFNYSPVLNNPVIKLDCGDSVLLKMLRK